MCRLKEVLAVKSSQKFRVTVAAGIGIVVVYAVWWFFLRPPGPDEVAQMTAQAQVHATLAVAQATLVGMEIEDWNRS